jgi:hypothetical protein
VPVGRGHIAGYATWAAGLLAATLAVDLLLIYYLHRVHREQLGVMRDAVRRVSHLGDKGEAGELDSIPAIVESAHNTTAVLAVGRQRMAVATEISYQAIQLSDVQRCIRAQLLHVWFIHSKMRNSLGPEKVKKLVYIKTNYAAVADVVRPCESDDDSDSDSPFPG